MTLHFFDLPLEITRMVFAQVVAEIGTRATVLRQVSRIFAHEILVAYASAGTLCVKDILRRGTRAPGLGNKAADDDSLVEFLARFISIRPYCQELAWHTNISAFLNHLLDEFEVAPQDRFEALRVLCHHIYSYVSGAAPPYDPPEVEIILYWLRSLPDDVGTTAEDLARHLLPAAILLGRPEIYESIMDLCDAEKSGEYFDSSIFGTPVSVAIKTHQAHLLPRMLASREVDYCPVNSSSNPLDVAVVADDADSLERLMKGFYFSREKLWRALLASARANNIALADKILSYASKKSVYMTPALDNALTIACTNGAKDLVSFFLQQPQVQEGRHVNERPWNHYSQDPQTPFDFGLSSIRAATISGHYEIVKMLVAFGVGFTLKIMNVAIICGYVDTVRFLLPRMLAEATGQEPEKWARVLMKLIQLWENHSKDVLCYLLEEVRVIDLAVACKLHLPIYGGLMHAACSHGNLEAFEILVRAGMPIDRPLGYEPSEIDIGQSENWTPMMVALTSIKGQSLIVPRLLHLGVEEMTGAQTSAWVAFQLGYYPRQLRAVRPRGETDVQIYEEGSQDLIPSLRDEVQKKIQAMGEEDGIFQGSSKTVSTM
ncbi:hypothetical protein GQ53DRAFT_837996 [Thozetella sp. PMI_491]|nr:hypothetical protein GQ53DRAFT_837996 [Thozetella sp. PMI_491]